MTSTARGQRTRNRLIEATTAIVRSHGYAAATTRAIAAAAGVSEATIYRHFPDKPTLFFTAVVERHAAVIEWIEQLPSNAGIGSLAGNIADAMRQLATLGLDLAPLELAILADPELARQRNAWDGIPPGPPTYLVEYLRAEQSRGRIRTDVDPEAIALVLLSTVFGIVAGQIGAETAGATGLIDAAASVMVNGLSPQPSGGDA